MEILESLINFFSKPQDETMAETPEGVCPLCWGHQEYDHKIRQLFKDKQLDVNNHKKRYMIVQQFVKENIDGIKLKKGKTIECPTCGNEHEQN